MKILSIGLSVLIFTMVCIPTQAEAGIVLLVPVVGAAIWAISSAILFTEGLVATTNDISALNR
jgi:hypothetical protein